MPSFYSSSQPRREITNVEYNIVGNKLTLEIDLGQENGPSQSGKTVKIGSTHGWVPVDDDGAMFSLNVHRKLGSSPIVIA